jgi:DNA-binding MarR family transcriptional regulator
LVPRVLLALPVLLALCATVASADQAFFVYELGALVEGSIESSCRAGGLFLEGAGALVVNARTARYERYETRINFTRVGSDPPQVVELDRSQSVHATPLEGERLEIAWGHEGVVRIFGRPGPLAPGSHSFDAAFSASSLHAMPVAARIPGVYFVREGLNALDNATGQDIRTVYGGIGGRVRDITLADGNIAVTGDLTIYLQAASISAGAFRERLPAYRENATVLPGAVGVETLRIHHAFLHVENASLMTPPSRLYCRDIAGQVEGRLLAWQATGTASLDERRIEFDRQDVEIIGSIAWTESLVEGPGDGGRVRAQAEGSFRMVGVDHEPMAAAVKDLPLAQVGLAATLLALLAAALYAVPKYLLPLFSRIADHEIDAAPSRRLILDAVHANPGASLRRVASVVGMSETVVRYHTARLERAGRLTSVRSGRERRLFLHRAQPPDPVALDRLGHAVLERFGGRRVAQIEVLRTLAAELGVSRPGVFKALRRLERRGRLMRHHDGRRVWVVVA